MSLPDGMLRNSCNIEQIGSRSFNYFACVKKNELTPEQISAVSCPTCGARVGKRCELNTGTLRFGPHLDRKFAAIQKAERKAR